MPAGRPRPSGHVITPYAESRQTRPTTPAVSTYRPTCTSTDRARLVMKTPAQGAGTPIYLASSPEVEGITGRYYAGRKAQDLQHARRLIGPTD